MPFLSRFPNMLPQYHVYNMLDETTGEVVLIADFNPLLEEGRYFMTIPTILRPSTGGAASYSVLVTGLADNRIVCEGGVPPFTFVAGQDLYYTDLLAVCAGSIYGGNNLGNLGGSCGRTASGGYLLTFSSVLRHPEAEGPYASLLKLYCATKCKCKDDPTNHSDFLMSDENGPITITDLDNGVFEARDIDGRAATFTATHRANNRVDVSVVTRPSSACSMTDCKKPLLDLVLCADPSQTLCRPVNTAFINTTTTLPDPVESIRKVQRGSEPACVQVHDNVRAANARSTRELRV
ncbi:MAG: hypothetical protein M1814_005115 [Vezdaea aestivalis]|nr:MAG: hypothetical protein M1814_005115 [Vezdaea aestivalis]